VPSVEIPEAVRRLIIERIDSVSELEALLLLREEPTRSWTAEEAGQRLYVSTAVAGYILAVLTERGFFAKQGDGWVYAPVGADTAASVDQLAHAYTHSLIEITRAIHNKPSASVLDFANAFRLRRKD
jgi:hypothetical protein